MLDINNIQEELATQFPELSFFITWRLLGKCIVAKKSKYNGADIFIKKKRIVVEASIPEWKTRMFLGAGAVYLKYTDRKFSETALRVKDFLSNKYDVRLRT